MKASDVYPTIRRSHFSIPELDKAYLGKFDPKIGFTGGGEAPRGYRPGTGKVHETGQERLASSEEREKMLPGTGKKLDIARQHAEFGFEPRIRMPVAGQKMKEAAEKALKDKIVGGLGDNKSDSDFDPRQLAAGIKVEMEHTKDKSIAKEIAKDHLTEDKNYYIKLAKMEAKKGIEKAGGKLLKQPTGFGFSGGYSMGHMQASGISKPQSVAKPKSMIQPKQVEKSLAMLADMISKAGRIKVVKKDPTTGEEVEVKPKETPKESSSESKGIASGSAPKPASRSAASAPAIAPTSVPVAPKPPTLASPVAPKSPIPTSPAVPKPPIPTSPAGAQSSSGLALTSPSQALLEHQGLLPKPTGPASTSSAGTKPTKQPKQPMKKLPGSAFGEGAAIGGMAASDIGSPAGGAAPLQTAISTLGQKADVRAWRTAGAVPVKPGEVGGTQNLGRAGQLRMPSLKRSLSKSGPILYLRKGL